MDHLALTLLGSFRATLNGEQINGFESNKVRALLAYLAIESNRPHTREKLAGLLWPERPETMARSNLRYALSNLRKVIGDRQRTDPVICVSRQTIQFDPGSAVGVDAIFFSGLLDNPEARLQELEMAISLYQGEFLEGFSMSDSAAYEEWLLLERERFRRLMIDGLQRAASVHIENGDLKQALPLMYRQVGLEPWREEVHRQLMSALMENHQRGAALAQYEVCRRTLAQELGVEPSRETTRLYEQIRDGVLTSRTPEKPFPTNPIDQARIVSSQQSDRATQHRFGRLPRVLDRFGALFGIAGLLLVLTGMAILWTARGRSLAQSELDQRSSEQLSSMEYPKVVHVCEGIQPAQICVGYPETGQFVQLTHDLEFEWIHPQISWSQDGQQILFAGRLPGEEQAIFLMDASGSVDSLRQLTTGDAPAWSPDGKRIALLRNGDLWVMNADGAQAHQITFQLCITTIAWSPDSQRIAFINNLCEAKKPLSIRMIDAGGSHIQSVYRFDQHGGGDLAWSPDGSRIACFCVFAGKESMWLFNADGSGEAHDDSSNQASWRSNYWPQWVGGD